MPRFIQLTKWSFAAPHGEGVQHISADAIEALTQLHGYTRVHLTSGNCVEVTETAQAILALLIEARS